MRTTQHPTPGDLWADVVAVRERAPLVHSITNFVVINFTANALLAAGASPVMAHARDEVEDTTGFANALVLNIGTLSPAWIESMELALRRARERGIPVVLDPVGAGAIPFRSQAVARLLEVGTPTVIRGNASEIMSVAGVPATSRGVDSTAASGEAVAAARTLAHAIGGVVCVSGADDHVVDAHGRWLTLSNGHPWMTRVTGVGCSASALVGAFAAVQPDPWRAAAAAMAMMGVVGEWAAEQARHAGGGVGTLQYKLLDGLHLLDAGTFASRLKLRLNT